MPINELRPLVAASSEATPPPVTLSTSTHLGTRLISRSNLEPVPADGVASLVLATTKDTA